MYITWGPWHYHDVLLFKCLWFNSILLCSHGNDINWIITNVHNLLSVQCSSAAANSVETNVISLRSHYIGTQPTPEVKLKLLYQLHFKMVVASNHHLSLRIHHCVWCDHLDHMVCLPDFEINCVYEMGFSRFVDIMVAAMVSLIA